MVYLELEYDYGIVVIGSVMCVAMKIGEVV